MEFQNQIRALQRNAFLPILTVLFVLCALLDVFWMWNSGSLWLFLAAALGFLASLFGIWIVIRAGWLLSEQRRVADSVEHSERNLRLYHRALQTMQLGVTITNTSGTIVYVNPAEATQHGYAAEELIGKDVKIFAPPEYWEAATVEQIQEMKTWRRVSVNLRKDGTIFPVELVSGIVADETGRPVGILTTCKDLTGKLTSS